MTLYDELLIEVNNAASALRDAKKIFFKSNEIKEWIQQNRSADWDRFSPSFQPTFSLLTSGDEECIVRRAPGTYMYTIKEVGEMPSPPDTSVPANLTQDAPTNDKEDVGAKKLKREDKLYTALKIWLKSRHYKAAITADNKRGGAWGNPDVTGIRVDELPLGNQTFECATIEAKLNSSDWVKDIFQAVSHKRFAHRAYFAFAIGTDTPSLDDVKDADKMREYAEKYRVGLLVIFISSNKYDLLTNGLPEDLAKWDLESEDDYIIETLFPAFYEPVQAPAFTHHLREVLGIRTLEDLTTFGA
jgi:hypothetical protein